MTGSPPRTELERPSSDFRAVGGESRFVSNSNLACQKPFVELALLDRHLVQVARQIKGGALFMHGEEMDNLRSDSAPIVRLANRSLPAEPASRTCPAAEHEMNGRNHSLHPRPEAT